MKTVDLRSDTVTRPCASMREAMMRAEVGDDVFGEDPTVNLLQERVAGLLGKEAALFVPSGTMGNEVCIKAHTSAGDEVIAEEESHIVVYETAGPSLLSGVQLKPLRGRKGLPDAGQIREAIRPRAYYMPRTALICLENTHGSSGGSVLPLDGIRKVREVAVEEGIPMHLDGARLWNACAASGTAPAEYSGEFDSVSVCFSKGLGAPVGSMVAGSAAFIARARKYRKVFGGGMRQAGILAAAALYAVDHNLGRLAEDHAKARFLAESLADVRALRVDPERPETNMVFIGTAGTGMARAEVIEALRGQGVLVVPEHGDFIRAVTHLDVSMDDVRHAAGVFRSLFP